MSTAFAGTIDANGVRLHVERSGGTRPPLVLLHGFTDDGRCWGPISGAFTDAFEVVTMDTRGHGRSEAPATGYRLLDTAQDVIAVARALGLERPAILGHSLGAVTALVVAGLEPGLPSRIVLEDPPVVWAYAGPAGDEAAHAGAATAGIEALKRLTRDELVAGCHAENPGWPEAEVGPWVESKLALSPLAVALATPASFAAIDLPGVLRAIACPVTLLHGDAALGAMATPADLEALRRLVPQLEVVHVPGAGHSIRRDRPGPYREAVRRALGA